MARSAAQQRVITAALVLFSEHGINGTSLQMIADAIGVTKAAVYHQFRTKEEIVVAAAEVELDRLEAALDAAEAEPSRTRAVAVVVEHVVDAAVERRRWVGTLQSDPVMVRTLATHEPFRRQMDRLHRLLAGDDADEEARVRAAMVSAAIGGAVVHPLVRDLDDATLRAEVLRLALRYLDLR
jgi:AcrR family transcriptional regulator